MIASAVVSALRIGAVHRVSPSTTCDVLATTELVGIRSGCGGLLDEHESRTEHLSAVAAFQRYAIRETLQKALTQVTATYIRAACRLSPPELVRINLMDADDSDDPENVADSLVTCVKPAGGRWRYDAALGKALEAYTWLHR